MGMSCILFCNLQSTFARASGDEMNFRRVVHSKKAHDDKKAEFAKHIEALNRQFKSWFKTTLAQKPDEVYSAAVQDYMDHVAALQARYLRTYGEVMTFGSGDCGQLAHGVEEDRDLMVRYPRIVRSLRDKRVAMIACGGLHNAVVTEDGQVYTWGCADDGSLGRSGDENVPSLVPGLEAETAVGVACGDTQTLVCTVQGKVFGWGCFRDKEGKKFFNPDYGTVGAALEKDVKKQQDKALLVQGFAGAADPGNAGVVELACGSSTCLARCADGSAYSWGLGELGELGRGKLPPLRNPAGEYQLGDILREHITPRRMQVCVGGVVTAVGERLCSRSVGSGAYHSLLVLVARGGDADSGGLYCCGLNNYGQLGLGAAAEAAHDLAVLNRVERVHEAGSEAGAPFPAHCAVLVATGGVHHSLALCREDGATAIYAWGRSDSGQLGIKDVGQGAGDSAPLPRRVPLPAGAAHVQQIACGGNHNIVVAGAGADVYTWGYGDMLALGHGKEQDEWTPKKINFGAGASVGANVSEGGSKAVVVSQVAGGGQHSAIVAQVTVVK